jgi:hypothetical protein
MKYGTIVAALCAALIVAVCIVSSIGEAYSRQDVSLDEGDGSGTGFAQILLLSNPVGAEFHIYHMAHNGSQNWTASDQLAASGIAPSSAALPAGGYNMSVNLSGYLLNITDFQLTAGQSLTIYIPLELRTCTDSDGGQNFNVAGQTVSNYWSFTQYDFCSGSVLTEGYCNADHYLRTVTYTCPNGCYYDACIAPGYTPRSCVDTDGGDNIAAQGAVTVTFGPNGPTSTFVDACHGPFTLEEQTCASDGQGGQSARVRGHYCASGCSQGLCRNAVVALITDSPASILKMVE